MNRVVYRPITPFIIKVIAPQSTRSTNSIMSEGQLETPNYTVQLVLLNVLMVVLTVIFTIYSSLADKKKKLKDAEKKRELVMGKEASVEAAKIKTLRQGLKGSGSSSGRSKRRETKQNPMDIELTEI